MCLSGPGLPDTLVGFLPVAADVFAEGAEHPLRLAIKGAAGSNEVCHGVDHFPVHIQLPLFGCGIANANRSRTLVTGELLQDAFAGGASPYTS
jgi:hypothetical protein